MDTTQGDAPLHLSGNNAPVRDEVDLELDSACVRGTIPPELDGTLVRNGPNSRTGWSAHLYDGDGMLHAVTLRGGRALRYRNRYVRTPLLAHPGTPRVALALDTATGHVDHRVSTANTSVVVHAGRLLALEEGGFPYEVTSSLETVGPFTFHGALRTPMTAHPKVCPTTGELLFFGYQLRPPYLTYHRADVSGRLVASEAITLDAASMMHDFAITDRSVVFADSPIVFDPAGLAAGGPPWRWDDRRTARFGVMPRNGTDADVRWYEAEPGHVSHVANAWEEPGGTIVIVGTRLPRAPRAGAGLATADDVGGGLPALHEWRIDRSAAGVAERPLDDTSSEYPRIAEQRTGVVNRYVYSTSFVLDAEPDRSHLYRYDLAQGASRRRRVLPAGHTCGEPVFVPRRATGGGATREGDGYVLTVAHDRARGTSYVLVLDAVELDAAPVAEVHLPVRVPAGFHGAWVPGLSIG